MSINNPDSEIGAESSLNIAKWRKNDFVVFASNHLNTLCPNVVDESWFNRERVERELVVLRALADSSDAWLRLDKEIIVLGGQEHDIIYKNDWRIHKITKYPGWGRCITSGFLNTNEIGDLFNYNPATPGDYLRRLCLLNELFPGLNRLEGFCEVDDYLSIITSQPFIKGENLSEEILGSWLELFGCINVARGVWFDGVDLGIFDVWPKNIIQDMDWNLVPIDIIPIRVRGKLLERLQILYQWKITSSK